MFLKIMALNWFINIKFWHVEVLFNWSARLTNIFKIIIKKIFKFNIFLKFDLNNLTVIIIWQLGCSRIVWMPQTGWIINKTFLVILHFRTAYVQSEQPQKTAVFSTMASAAIWRCTTFTISKIMTFLMKISNSIAERQFDNLFDVPNCWNLS